MLLAAYLTIKCMSRIQLTLASCVIVEYNNFATGLTFEDTVADCLLLMCK